MEGIKTAGLLILCAVMFLPGRCVRAAVPDRIQKEIQYTTEDASEKKPFDETITVSGRAYDLERTSYEVIEKNPVKEKEKVTYLWKSRPMKNQSYQPAKNMEKEGVSYQLSETVKKEKVITKAWKQAVTAYSVYTDRNEAAGAPQSKTVRVKDSETGKRVSVSCRKTAVERMASVWEDSYIDLLFKRADADTFIWNGIRIGKEAVSPLSAEYYETLIKSVGGRPETYRVKSVAWQGKSFKKNGILYRKARAFVKKKSPRYRITYDGQISHKGKKRTVYLCTYEGVKETENGQAVYRIAARAEYMVRDAGIKIPAAVLTVAAVLVLITVIGILFLVLRKRNREGRR